MYLSLTISPNHYFRFRFNLASLLRRGSLFVFCMLNSCGQHFNFSIIKYKKMQIKRIRRWFLCSCLQFPFISSRGLHSFFFQVRNRTKGVRTQSAFQCFSWESPPHTSPYQLLIGIPHILQCNIESIPAAWIMQICVCVAAAMQCPSMPAMVELGMQPEYGWSFGGSLDSFCHCCLLLLLYLAVFCPSLLL